MGREEADAQGDAPRLEIALLLDDSKSMYEASGGADAPNAVVALKNAAAAFMEELHSNTRARFKFHIYRFANTVSSIASLDEIPDTYKNRAEHFTSLYHAVLDVSRKHPQSILVLFSDGADNYSQNHGVADLASLSREIRRRRIAVHAVGFGNLEGEYDRKGNSAKKALRQIAQRGSLRFADNSSRFHAIFGEIAKRITAIYTLTYFSPNLSGTHSLLIKVYDGAQQGASRVIHFKGKEELHPAANPSPATHSRSKRKPSR